MGLLIMRELNDLKRQLLGLTAIVESRVQKAIQSLMLHDVSLADEVIKGDAEIDNIEIRIEEECLKVLALHQPVANDLRFIVSVLKINNDLERIADLAANAAARAKDLSGAIVIDCPYDVDVMAKLVLKMLKMSLDSLVNQDADTARKIVDFDDEVDALHKQNFGVIKTAIREKADLMDGYMLYLSVSRYLERIADLATNIAEDVVYLMEGEIIRHGGLQEVPVK
ncbi:MAG: phosphate signaling complex protein PhoU [Desulfuromonadales bacterium]|nr:phosphate signaling complex protein PhoU [Desulfuromonadales bacterium]MBN2791625.1 phosphate signaling complex protein PhoU [Desulfuromonadales bacterium]